MCVQLSSLFCSREDSDEKKLKLAEVHRVLGEVSLEKGIHNRNIGLAKM